MERPVLLKAGGARSQRDHDDTICEHLYFYTFLDVSR